MMKELCDNLNRLASKYPSHTEFANHIGFSRQTVGFWLSGERSPSAVAIWEICSKENLSADWLLGLNSEKAKNRSKSDLLSFIEDINPIEIASHIADGTLETWCNTLKDCMRRLITLDREGIQRG